MKLKSHSEVGLVLFVFLEEQTLRLASPVVITKGGAN